jgi:hypothetical protein
VLRVHKLIDQLVRGEIGVAYEVTHALDPHPNTRLPALIEPLIRSHKFALHIDSINDNALKDTAAELWRAKLLQPPFPLTWWEVEMPNSKYVEGILVRHDAELNRTTGDIFSCWSGKWIDQGVRLLLQPDSSPQEAAEFFYPDAYLGGMHDAKEFALYGTMHLISACALLISKEALVTTEAAPAALNAKRKASGKQPLFEHKTITVPALNRTAPPDGGTHASPRLHWRRGHVRKLPAGYMVAVRPCLVGLAERGIITKDYLVKGDSE